MNTQPLDAPDARSYRTGLLGVVVAALALATFYPTLNHQLLYWDDLVSIIKNPELNPPNLHGLAEFWRHPIQGYNRSYVPLTYTVWWTVAHFARVPDPNGAGMIFEPAAFHALNLIFHLAASVLAFAVLRRLVKSDGAAALGALLFALHPLQVEPLCWAANMYTPLSGALSLAAMLLYLRFSENGQDAGVAKKWTYLALATVCFTLALLTKPTVVLLPLIIAAIDMLLNRRRLRDCAPLCLWLPLAAACILLTRHVHPGSSTFKPPLYLRPFVAADAFNFYLQKLLMPWNLAADYSRSPRWVVQQKWIWFAWIVPAAALGICWVLRRRFPWLLCGLAIFVLGMLPMLGLVPFDYQLYSTVADRYAYFSIFGAALAVAFASRHIAAIGLSREWRFAGVGAACLVIVALALQSRVQTRYWEHTGTLLARTLDVNPRSLMAHLQMGSTLLKTGGPGEMDAALAHLRATEELDPNDPWIMYEEGTALLRKGEPAAAAAMFRHSLELKPEEPATGYMLARALAAAGDRTGAIAAFLEIDRRFPSYADTDLKLAEVLAANGDVTGARSRYQRFLISHPDSSEARLEFNRLMSQRQQAATDLHQFGQ